MMGGRPSSPLDKRQQQHVTGERHGEARVGVWATVVRCTASRVSVRSREAVNNVFSISMSQILHEGKHMLKNYSLFI